MNEVSSNNNGTINILFINNDGGGFADRLQVAVNTTVAKLFGQKLPGSDPKAYLIRVNRQPATPEQILVEGDRVTFTPTKIEGAVGILFINNDGGGFADRIDVEEGTTVNNLFGKKLPGSDPKSYLIRVNRQPATPEQVLVEGDRVTFTPTKIEGATNILFINNDGGGFADRLEVEEGTTVNNLFGKKLPGSDPKAYLIRVNRQPATPEQVLQEGDRVTFTPTKIEGAH